LKDSLLSENISLRAYIQHLEETSTVGEVLSLRQQVNELREINEECRASLSVAVEGLKQAKDVESENERLKEHLQHRETELRQEFLVEIERLQNVHNEQMKELKTKLPTEEEFFNLQQLMEENSILKEKMSEFNSTGNKRISLHATADQSNFSSIQVVSGRAINQIKPQGSNQIPGSRKSTLHEDLDLSATSGNRETKTRPTASLKPSPLEKLRKQIAELVFSLDSRTSGSNSRSHDMIEANSASIHEILEFECESLLDEAKQGVRLLKSLIKSGQLKTERIEIEISETKNQLAASQAEVRDLMEQNDILKQELEIESTKTIKSLRNAEAINKVHKLQREKEISEDRQDTSKNVREYLEQKVTAERLEKMVYRELVEKLKSWISPEYSNTLEDFVSISRKLAAHQRLKSQGLEDILDTSHSREEELQNQKEILESQLERLFWKINTVDSSSKNIQIFRPVDKETRSVRPSFTKQQIDSPSVRSSSFFATTDDANPKELLGIGIGIRQQSSGQISQQSKIGANSEPDAGLNILKKPLQSQFFSSVAPKILPSPSRSPIDKLMEDHSLNFGHLRDKLKDIKAKLNS
jgi:hypothetical protein